VAGGGFQEYHPMVIRSASVELWDWYGLTSVNQSSPYPCQMNMISVSIATNVPLFPRCFTTFTVSGLTGSETPDGIENVDLTSGFVAPRSWQETGTLEVAVRNIVPSYTVDGYSFVDFQFYLENPANGQGSPVVSIAGSFDNSSTPWATSWQSDESWITGYDYPAEHWPVSWSDFRDVGAGAVAKPINYRRFPLFVMQAEFAYTLAGQSSPFPCDDNVITVVLQTNVPLLSKCEPMITLHGITEVRDRTNGPIEVSFWDAGWQDHMTNPIQGQTINGTWDAGTLEVNLTSLVAGDADIDVVVFTFNVQNLERPASSVQNMTVTGSLDSPNYPTTLQAVEIAADMRAGLYSSSPVGDYTGLAAPFDPTNNANFDTGAADNVNVQVWWGDAQPMYLRDPYFTVRDIVQETPFPCAMNRITVALASSVPLFTNWCEPKVMIKGLVASSTYETNMTLFGAVNVFGGWGQWDQAEGSLTMNITSTMIAGQDYVLEFSYYNQNHQSSSSNVTVRASPSMMVADAQTMWPTWAATGALGYTVVGGGLPNYVMALNFFEQNINQTSPFPCDDNNVITIAMRSTVPLLTTCYDPMTGAHNVTPSLEITGLLNSVTNTSFVDVRSSDPAVWPATAAWDREQGTFGITPMIEALEDVLYVLRFTLINPSSDFTGTAISISVDTITHTTEEMNDWGWGDQFINVAGGGFQEYHPMVIRWAAVVESSFVAHSSYFPCDNNDIQVKIFTNVPVFSSCSPTFTISGLTGSVEGLDNITLMSLEPTNIGIDGVSLGDRVVPWVQNSGTMYFNISNGLASTWEDGYSFFVFNISVMNQQMYHQGPDVTIEAHYGSYAWDTFTQSGADMPSSPMYIVHPSIDVVRASQNTPYPCDNNTIVVEFEANVPTFSACMPQFTITGLTGTAQPQSGSMLLSGASTPSISANGSMSTMGTMFWNASSGTLEFSILDGATITHWNSPSFTLEFDVVNPAAHQSAPTISVAASYHRDETTAWSIDPTSPYSTAATISLDTDWVTDASGDTTEYLRPMYIREASFQTADIGQTTPWPAADNTITVTLMLDIALVISCNPVIEISALEGACIGGDVARLGGTGSHVFQSLNGSVGWGSWSAEEETLSLVASDGSGIASVWSQQTYTISIGIKNPVIAQDSPDVAAQVRFGSTLGNDDPAIFSHDTSDLGVTTGDPYLTWGDAKALKVYAPEFFIKSVRQSTPMPGAMNTFTVTLASNIDMLPPAAITISGFDVNDDTESLAYHLDLASSPMVSLFSSNQCETSPGGAYSCIQDPSMFRATPSTSDGEGYFDNEFGRLVLYLSGTMTAGDYHTFQFELRNPVCNQTEVQPCIRASRILQSCLPAGIARSRMSVDSMSTSGMERVRHDVTGDVPAAQHGEALPLLIRAPSITVATIYQSSAYPCDNNRLTITLDTDVPLLAYLGHNITISGLKGIKDGQAVSMAGPESGQVDISTNTGVLSSTGVWNLEEGTLVVPVLANSTAGLPLVFSFDLTNPSSAQDCAEVSVSISGFCFADVMLETAEIGSFGTTLPYHGSCGGFNTSSFPVDTSPDSFAGTRGHLAGGRCPLMVVEQELHITYVNQSSQYPCTENIITVMLASNVPLDRCNPFLNLTGLNGTMTNSSDLSVTILQPTAASITGSWDFDSNLLSLDVASVVPSEACSVFSFQFEVKNQMQPRQAAELQMSLSGDFEFALEVLQVDTPSTYSDWYLSLPGLSSADGFMDRDLSADPMYILTPQFTNKMMAQTSPWPADLNTLTLTLASNVPLTPDCSVITISNLEGACATDGSWDMPSNAVFADLDGTANFGTWEGVYDSSRDTTVGKMVFVPTARTEMGTLYAMSFEVRNPVSAQNSPAIRVSASGIPFDSVLVDKDLDTVLPNPCAGDSIFCEFEAGDAAPLLVYGPLFLQKDVSQSNPYPMKPNTITVTLLSNIPFSEGSLITISNLKGGQTTTGAIGVTPRNGEVLQSGVGGDDGTGAWDFDAKKLTLRVGAEIAAGTQMKFSFTLENPVANDDHETCGFDAPNVCVRASRISTPCLDCSRGECVTLSRQAMDPDFVKQFEYGSLGSWLYHDEAYYSPSAVVTYGTSPPAQGDAYPFNVYAPEWIFKNIVQSNYYPGQNNTISVLIATTVPLMAGTTLTLTGLEGSVTDDNSDFMLATMSSVFDGTASWTNEGTLVVGVIEDTIAGSPYNFSFVLKNPDCDNPAASVSIQSSLCEYWGAFGMDHDPTLLDLYDANSSDSRPLFVESPSFLAAEVWQESPFAGADNVIHVKFSTNVNLLAGTKLTVSGLSTGVASSTVTVTSTGSILSANGEWNNGVLIVEVETDSVAGDDYELSFDLINPLCCQGAVSVTLEADVFCFSAIVAESVTDAALLTIASDGDDEESAPLFVRCPDWAVSTSSQTTSNPCSKNTIEVILQVNVPVLSGTTITLTGFSDSRTENGTIALDGTFAVDADFAAHTGTLVFVTDSDVDADENMTVIFELVNPVQPVDVKTLRVNLNDSCSDDQHRLEQERIITQQGDGVIYVEQAAFEMKMLGQKTPWPGAANVITVTLSSNVPLFGDMIMCNTTVTMRGFEGACIEETDFSLMGPDAGDFTDAEWDDDEKMVTMRTMASLFNTSTVFSFALTNPTDAQPSPLLEIYAEGIPIDIVRMEKDDDSLPNSQYDHNRWDADRNLSWWNDTGVEHVGSTNGAVFESVDLDAQPLKVHSPAFIVRQIGQTSPYPGANNTMMVTIRPNLDLSVDSVITISVLDHEDGTTSGASGPIPLFDGDSYPINASRWNNGMSFENDEWYFAAAVGGDPGYGLWNDEAKTLTLFVVTPLTAGSYYTFQFTLKNPLCGQDVQPVCIRARNIKVGCDTGVVIPRRLMDGDTGDSAPLYIIHPNITLSQIDHSTPWPSETNTITITLTTNVPLLMSAFHPRITITNLVTTQTNSTTVTVNMAEDGGADVDVDANWDLDAGALDFTVPMDTVQDTVYLLTFDLVNRNCEQESPEAFINIDGICFDEAVLDPQPLTVCSDVETDPLQVVGGPCGSSPTSATFTVSKIGQETPYPGCVNLITVTFRATIPLTSDASASIQIDFDDSLTIGLADGYVTLGENSTLFGMVGNWTSVSNTLTLPVADGEELDACQDYVISFNVTNPVFAQSYLAVNIVGLGEGDTEIVAAKQMTVPSDTDQKPMKVDDPTFLVHNISQSSPYPGGENTLTVTFSVNTNLQVGSRVVIHNIIGAEAEEGDIDLGNGGDAAMFQSLEGTASSGTWDNCEKALILEVASDLGCDGDQYTIEIVVMNPLLPQTCARVLINASGVEIPELVVMDDGVTEMDITVSNQAERDALQFIWDGYEMVREMNRIPAGIYGAVGEDSCPMTVWPAAFVVKTIGQSVPYPCAPNTITVTLATNVPLYPVVQYPNNKDPIYTMITVSRLLVKADDAVSLPLTTYVVDDNGRSNATLFKDSEDGAENRTTWQPANSLYEDESSVSVYLVEDAMECCVPGDDDMTIEISFEVTNPSQSQDPSVPVSIGASGIPIVESAMVMGFGDRKPLFLQEIRLLDKMIVQSTSGPCAENTITVTLQPSIDLYKACSPFIFIGNLSSMDLDTQVELTDISFTSNADEHFNETAMWDSTVNILTVSLLEDVSADTELSFSFVVDNPTVGTVPDSIPTVQIDGIGMPVAIMDRSSDPDEWPITVREATFTTKGITQSSPYPAAQNIITVNLEISEALAGDCDVVITISGLENACVEDEENEVILDNAPFQNVSLWHPGNFSLTIPVAFDGIEKDTEYEFTFTVRNPTSAQSAPDIFIEASGIPIAIVPMDRNPSQTAPDNVVDATVQEGQPLYVRGLVTASAFTMKSIGQSTAEPGAMNDITVTLTTNVPLTKSSPSSMVTVSGLKGAIASNGPISVTQETPVDDADTEYGSFSGEWDQENARIVLEVVGVDTLPGEDYVLTFNVTNPRHAQASPAIYVESSGIVIQPAVMESSSGVVSTVDDNGEEVDGPVGSAAPMFVLGPRLISRSTKQTNAWPAQPNMLTFSFQSTVAINPLNGSRFSFIISGLRGVDLQEGAVDIEGMNASLFTACETVADDCDDSQAHWNPGARKLVLNLLNPLMEYETVEVDVPILNAMEGQDPPRITIETSSDFETFDIAPADFEAADDVQGTNNVTLLIHRSASFLVKEVSQSTAAPGATNTILLRFQPQFTLTGEKEASITVTGLKGSSTPDMVVKLLDASAVFNSTARWIARTGTIILKVASMQEVPSDAITEVKFDLMNPKYPQSGPSIVHISGRGDVPISAAAMTLGDDDKHPLRVIAAQLTDLGIGQSSTAPSDMNTITVTFKPSVVLSSGRHSVITIDGLVGSDTVDTMALPITMETGEVGTFYTPIPHLRLSFSTDCQLSDDQVMLMGDMPERTDLSGTVLFFGDEGECAGRWTEIVDYDSDSHCATLVVDDSDNWSDGGAKCMSLGVITSFQVMDGGEGYESGDFIVDENAPGESLMGNCSVDDHNAVTEIFVSDGGSGYSMHTMVKCPSACEADICAEGGGNKPAHGLEVRPVLAAQPIFISAAQWHRGTGTVKLAVRDKVSVDEATEISFELKNSVFAQAAQKSYIMASGATPVGSSVIPGDVMEIAGFNTSVTAVCNCTVESDETCTCATSFSGLPLGRAVYALKAEVQCNGGSENITVFVNDEAQDVEQPPDDCVDSCLTYHTLFSWASVKDAVDNVNDGTLPVSAMADNLVTDYCGAGDNLKIIFTLLY